MATLFSCFCMLYLIVGFKIMEKGNMSLYTLFLMAGGMVVPYIWGVLFLDEEFTLLRTLGLIVITLSLVISNSGEKKPDKKQILLCIIVFLLNGLTSVSSKIHQINPVSLTVTSTYFTFIVMSVRAIISSIALLFVRKKDSKVQEAKTSLKSIFLIMLLASLVNGFSSLLVFVGAVDLPATVLYPLITGGSVILSAFAGIIAFKEKLSARDFIGIAVCFFGTLLFL